MGILGPSPEFDRVDMALDRVMRDAKEAARLLHPVYGYDFTTIPEAKAEEVAEKLEECAAFLRRHVEVVQKDRSRRMAA